MSNGANLNRDAKAVPLIRVINQLWRPADIALPAFASEENVKLHGEIHNMTAKINTLIQELLTQESYVNSMGAHKAAILTELQHAQERVDGKKKEAEAEEHLALLQERDIGWMKQRLETTRARAQELEYLRGKMDTQLQTHNARLAELKKEQQWLLDEQAEWKLAQEQKADDQFTLEKYRAVDDKTLQAVQQDIQRQRAVVEQLNTTLKEEVQSTQTFQVQLDKTAQQFQTVQEEREFAIQQLSQAVDMLDQKEEETVEAQAVKSQLEAEALELKLQDKELQEELNQQARELENARHDYDQAEREVQEAAAELEEARECERNMAGEILVEKAQLASLQRQIGQAEQTLQVQMEQQQARQAALEQLQKRFDLFGAADAKMAGEKQSVEQIIEQQQEHTALVKQELEQWLRIQKGAASELQQAGKNLHELKSEEATLKSSIGSYQAGVKHLEVRIAQMEQQLQQQRRHIYNSDFQIQALTRKLSHVRGDISAEEQMVLKRNIETLKNQLQIEQKSTKLVRQQTGSVLSEIGRVKRQLVEAQARRQRVDNVLNELVLAAQTQTDAQTESEDKKAEALLELDALRIQRQQAFRRFQEKLSVVFGLRNRSQQTQVQLVQRQEELLVAQGVVDAELRLLREELHGQRLELKKRRIAASKAECRCEVITARVAGMARQAKGAQGGEEADARTAQADAVIAIGRRKNDLYSKMAQLKAIEEKLEMEVKGLEQALGALQESNSKVRRMGRPAEARDQEELQKVREELSQVEAQVLYYVGQARDIGLKLEQLEQQNGLLRAEQDRLAEELNAAEFGDL